MYRSCISGFLAAFVEFASVTQANSQQTCRPALAFEEVRFSELKLPLLERKWTAIVSVDASRCAAHSGGHFEIVFSRLKEMGVDIEFREQFIWSPPSVRVSVDFWADEAVQHYWIDNAVSCPCAR